MIEDKLGSLCGILSTGILVAVSGLSGAAYADGQLTITSFGGSYQEAQRSAFFEPFSEAAGVEVLEDEWHGEMAKLRTMVESGEVTWDVLVISDGQLPIACDEGLVEPLDPSMFGGEDNFLDGWVHACGIGATVASIVVCYDDRAFPDEKPSTLADFWDVEKFPGPRAMKKWPKHNLEFALLADGVEPGQIYDVLATDEGVARSFKKLDELKPHVKVWFDSWAQPGQLLADGEVAMSIGTNGRCDIASKTAPNIKYFWDRQGYGGDMWSIVKGAKNKDNAVKFIEYASQPANAARLVDFILYPPPVPAALESMSPEMVAQMPTNPDNLKTAWVIDSRFWGDHLDDYEVRFQAWLSQ